MNDRSEPTAPDLVRGGVTVPGEERQRCLVYSRVMGYYAPTFLWNTGKQAEFHERKTFREVAQEKLEV